MTKNPQIRSYDDATFRRAIQAVDDHSYPASYARALAREFAGHAFSSLHEFPYLYLTSGVTEAMDWVLPRHRVAMNPNDYRYAEFYTRPRSDLHYQSYPFAGSGTLLGITEDTFPVFMDCSYIFATELTGHSRVVPDNVKYLAFSLSKSHNIADFRIGWLMTREQLQPQHVVQYEYGYVPHRHARVLEHAMSFAPNHLYMKHRPALTALYEKHGLAEHSTNLFAMDQNGQRVPYYTLLP